MRAFAMKNEKMGEEKKDFSSSACSCCCCALLLVCYFIAKCIVIFSSCLSSFPATFCLFAELNHWISKKEEILINFYLIGVPSNNLTSLTLIFALADVSMNEQLNCCASCFPNSLPTTLSSSKSHLLPTKTIGTSSVSFKKVH